MGVVTLLILLGLAVLPFAVLGAIVAPGPLPEARTLVIPHGTNIHEIATLLDANHVIFNSVPFRAAARFMANDTLKAGEYQFTKHQSIADIVLMMHEGKSVIRSFTVTEGTTSAEVVHNMQINPALSGDITTQPPEGSLLPETYNYSYGDSRAGLILRMQKGMQEALNDLWEKRDAGLPLRSRSEAVTMASIVEKETGKPLERARVAGVFYNRLRINMRLQSDPTVIYAITREHGALDHELDHNDLAFPSIYNTYVSDGLPPGPICNPGRAALEAALHPELNDYLYFVADGTGGHVFAHDLVTHNQNVTHWNELKAKP